MAEQLPGLELFLSSEKAVEGANKFRAAVESAAQAVERIGAVVDKLDNTLDRLGVSSRKAGEPLQKVGENAGRTGEQLARAGAGATEFERRLGSLGRTSVGVGTSLRLLLGTAGAVTGFAAGVQVFADYEDKLRILGSIAGATGRDLQKLESAAVSLSQSTRFTPREALQGLTELSRAGLSAEDAIKTLKPTADLARVGLLGLSDASAVVSKTLTQFQLGADQAARVADVLSKGANVSNADVATLADSLAKTGPVARQFGISLEDTVAALAKLADNGIQANIAGTGLQRVLIQLRNPTEEAQNALLGLGLAAEKVNPERAGLVGALRNLAGAGVTVQDAVSLVGTEFASLLTVLTGSVGSIDQVGEALRDSTGEAAKQAAAGADTLAAAFADLRSAGEQFAVSSARGGIGGALIEITRTGADVFRILAQDEKAMNEAGIAAQALAKGLQLAVVAGAALTANKLAQVVSNTTQAIVAQTAATIALDGATGTAAATASRAGRAFSILTGVLRANPFVAVATAIAAAGAALFAFGGSADKAGDEAAKNKREVDGLQIAYEELAKSIGKVAAGPGQFDNQETQLRDLRAAQIQLQEFGRSIEGISSERVDLRKVLGTAALDEVGGELQRIKQLIDFEPEIQKAAKAAEDLAKAVARTELPQTQARGDGFAREFQVRQRGAEAAAKVLDEYRERLRAFGIETDAAGNRTIGLSKAQEFLAAALAKLDTKAKDAGQALATLGKGTDLSSAVASVIAEREKELRLASAINEEERIKARLVAEAQQRKGGTGLTATEDLELAALSKKIAIQQRINEERRKEAQIAEKAAQLQRELPENFAELERKYQNQLDIARATGVERETLRAEIEAENDAIAIGLSLEDERFQKLRDRAIETARINAEERSQNRSSRGDRRRDEAFRDLEAQEALLKRTGAEREKYRLLIEAENAARQAGLAIGSAEFQDFVKRRVAAQRLAEESERLVGIFVQFGEAGSSALERLIIDMEKGRDVARAFAQDLARLALRQTAGVATQQIFAAAGQALANFFAPGPASTVPGGVAGGTVAAPGSTPRTNMTGGVIPAMSGQVVDEFGFLRRGSRTYSFAEGGKSTPEAILPLERDARGRLGVASSGGGGSTTINMSFPSVRSARDARGMRATIGQQVRQLREAEGRGRRGLRPAGQ